MRSSIIDKIVQRGGNSTTGHFPGRYVDVASELNLSSAVVSKIWKQFCETNSLSPLKNGGGNKSGLSEGDLQLIEVVKRPSTTYAELADILLEVGDIPRGGTSKTALSNAVRHRMPSQENFSYKKITHVAQERFTIQNMAYTQIFIDYLHTKDPYKKIRIQNAAARLIFGESKFCHITPLLKSLHWLPVKQRVKFKILLLTFKAIHGCSPQYITDLITIRQPTKYSLRSQATIELERPKGKFLATLGDRSFTAAAPKLWNNLPSEIRNVKTINSFKSSLKTFLFKNAF